jgi:hypothetical protein
VLCISDNNAKTATFCQALFRFAQIDFASRGRKKNTNSIAGKTEYSEFLQTKFCIAAPRLTVVTLQRGASWIDQQQVRAILAGNSASRYEFAVLRPRSAICSC